ncbi:MAG TPA: NADH-dependent [FeFe] hydrogenase, group A6 [bacterium]|nr:NADH-dependent [FeFe] hydrogenase, group A6 [bacterium]
MKIEVNGNSIEVKKGQTLLDALKDVGITIPTLCHMEDVFPSGACRMCVVEVEGDKNLVPSCAVEVREGMKVKTHSPRVLRARKTIIELLLASHPDDCLYCERNGFCELQSLSEELGISERRYTAKKPDYRIDNSSVSIVKDSSKCILCGRCVRVCEEVQGVSAIDFVGRGSKSVVSPAFNQRLNLSSCINCGQCVRVCPTGALTEHSNIKELISALMDPEKVVVVQHAPSVSVTIGEYFGYKEGTDVAGVLNAALRKLGFKKVFDTAFSADLTIMEEASELVYRIKNGGKLPMFTSCSPGWVKYVEQFYPEFIDNISSCKSPQQMLGSVIKNYFAPKNGIDPKKIFSVSIMPCTAKKFEAERKEMASEHGVPDIDLAITTRELAKLFKMFHIDFQSLEPEDSDNPFGVRSSAGKIFGVSGGVMEAALRTAHFLITGKEMENFEVKQVRDLDGIKETTIKIGALELNIAAVSGLGNAKKMLEDIKAGKKQIHFMEVMTCPGGCIAGGGQPYGLDKNKIAQRMKSLYKIDKDSKVKCSHNNESIKNLYRDFLGEPLGEKSHKLLHTKYKKRKTNY